MYSVKDKLGSGSYGDVHVIEMPGGEKKAFKKIERDKVRYIEMDILFRIDCPYLVKGNQVINTKNSSGVIMELMKGNIRSFNFKDYRDFFRMMGTLCYGLHCMHTKGFLHLDIKPLNALYDEVHIDDRDTYNAYLTDFGLSLRCDDVYSGINTVHLKMTPGYVPPEIMETAVSKDKKIKVYKYTDKTDVFALGVSFIRLLGFSYGFDYSSKKLEPVLKFWKEFLKSGKHARTSLMEIINRFNKKLKVKIPDLKKIQLVEFLYSMIRYDPNDRMSSKDLIPGNSLFEGMTFDSKCLAKPEEFYYVPYLNVMTMKGIKALRQKFETAFKEIPITVYFLAVEFFLRFMSNSDRDVDPQEYNRMLSDSVQGALNYYKGRFYSEDGFNEEDSFLLPAFTYGKMGINRYYYGAKYLDQLKLVDEILLKSPAMIHFYLVLDIQKLYKYFMDNYKIDKSKLVNQDVRMHEFFSLTEPKKLTTEIMKNFAPGEYKNAPKVLKMEKSENLESYSKFEDEMRAKILKEVSKRIEGYKLNLKAEIASASEVLETTNSEEAYKVVTENNSVASALQDYIDEFDYSVLHEKSLEKEKLSSYNIFFDKMGNASLLRINKKKEAVHYFSPKGNEELKRKCEKEGLNYDYSFNEGINPCRILETGLLVMIYVAKKIDKFNIRMLRCEDKTLKSLLVAMIIQNKF